MSFSYSLQDWRKSDESARSARWKIILYDLLRPWLSRRTSKFLSQSTLSDLNPTFVLPERGFPLETRRRWATNYQSLQGKTVLVQGTGTGWDVISWAKLKPAKIIATDLFSFADSWNEISLYCRQHFGVEVLFYQAPLEDHSFINSESIDLCASDAVYEHCKNLPQVMRETRRVLKANGLVYATYGPLWYCASGDHFDRGGLENAYNHLILDTDAYREYFNCYKQSDEDFQSGGRYIELELFSYLTTSNYLEIFRNYGFVLDELILEVSAEGLNFLGNYPERFNAMEIKYADRCMRDDFLIKANFVRLKKGLQ